MSTLKETEASLSYVHCLLYLVSLSVNVSIFHIVWLYTCWTDLIYVTMIAYCNLISLFSKHSLSGYKCLLDFGIPKIVFYQFLPT